MIHYKLTIEYDGTNYVGWQAQIDQKNKSIEEVLQNAIFNVVREKVKLNCAGRTDSGVHAIAQIADFFSTKKLDEFNMMSAINSCLAQESIAIVSCKIVDENFHSRFDAKERSYQYFIINRKARLGLMKNRAWHVPVKLNFDEMRKAASILIGEHDFSAFRDAKCQSNSAIKTINKIEIKQNLDLIIIEVSAKSFLHHMVRNIVGTLVLVGSGKIKSEEMENILASKNRVNSGPNAPACGLYFLEAKYL